MTTGNHEGEVGMTSQRVSGTAVQRTICGELPRLLARADSPIPRFPPRAQNPNVPTPPTESTGDLQMSLHNKQWLLIARATGEPTSEHFKLVEIEVPGLQDGEVLVRHHYLSLDPYMRGRMMDAKNYAALQPLNEVMIGGTVGEVA